MDERPATNQEIIHHFRAHRRVSFDHWARECLDRRTEHGVRHKTRGNSTLRVRDGVPMVRHLGEDYPLKATHYTLPSGRTFVASATII